MDKYRYVCTRIAFLIYPAIKLISIFFYAFYDD